MIGNYWNSAYRNLMKRKKFSFINIFGLAIGMAALFWNLGNWQCQSAFQPELWQIWIVQ